MGRPVKTISNAVGAETNDSARDPRSSHYIPSANSDQDILQQTVYDAQGRVSATIDALGNQTKFVYDTLGTTHPDSPSISSPVSSMLLSQIVTWSRRPVYDLAGRVVSTTDARGTVTAFNYDRIGRRLTVTQAVGTSLATTSYTCDHKGGRVLRTISELETGLN